MLNSHRNVFYGLTQNCNLEGIKELEALGVTVNISIRQTPIVFAYFHPLSVPLIKPTLNEIQNQKEIFVSGDVVLRFGFLEGDAINKCP